MKQYLELLKEVRDTGVSRLPARAGMPSTVELFAKTIEMDCSEHIPIVTTKKVSFHNILVELLWFLKGYTNIYYLHEQGVHIWDDDAYKHYLRNCRFGKGQEPLSKDDFIAKVGTKVQVPEVSPNYVYYGDLGNVYGAQWRRFGGTYDQLVALIKSLNFEPLTRYHIVTAWDPTDFFGDKPTGIAALPCCHNYFQCQVEGKDLNMVVFQRSADMFLGVPYNLTSYGLLLHILAALTNLRPNKLTWVGGHCHIYENHMDQVNEQLSQEPLEPSARVHLTETFNTKLQVVRKSLQTPGTAEYSLKWFIDKLEPHDIQLVDYKHLEPIKAPLSVGI